MNQKSATGMIQKFQLDGKVSLVTGASRGIGLAMAEGLAGAGSELVIVGRKIETLTPIAERIANETDRKILPIQADVSNLSEIDALVAQTVETFGRLDVLVNNAGGQCPQPRTGIHRSGLGFRHGCQSKRRVLSRKSLWQCHENAEIRQGHQYFVAHLSHRATDKCRLHSGEGRAAPINKTSCCGMGRTQHSGKRHRPRLHQNRDDCPRT